MEFIIREEMDADREAIFQVNHQAFESRTEALLVDLLRERGKSVISLVAQADGKIIGHILFSTVSIEPEYENWHALGLAPLAVLPEYQRQGIGKALVMTGLDRCRELGIDLVFVLGHPAYYPGFGFSRASDYGFTNEYQAEEAFMVMELKPGALDQFAGLVKYAPEFTEIGA